MAKKAAKPAKGARKMPPRKSVSVKGIIAQMDRTLQKLERPAAMAKESVELRRARLGLRAARDAVHGLCVPGFDIPNE